MLNVFKKEIMAELSGYVLFFGILVAIGMQVYSIMKIQGLYRQIKGVIQSRQDLGAVKEVINLNMKLAIFYFVLAGIIMLMVIILIVNGMPGRGFTMLFIFGIVTLPAGLIGKHFEKKIKSLSVESSDKEIAKTYERYLIQWKEARFKLPD